MLYARVKAKSPVKTTTACGGLTFTKDEFRLVPAHEEAAALADPMLETTDKPLVAAPQTRKPEPPKGGKKNADGTVRLVDRNPGGVVVPSVETTAQPETKQE